jgi:tetratricopeptide (TPR) repeat protein
LVRAERDPDLRLEVAVLLRGLYDPQRDWEKLVVVLEVELEESQDPETRLGCLVAIAELHEGQAADGDAFEAYARAFVESPESEDLEARLERLAQALGSLHPLAQIYLSVAPTVEDEVRSSALSHRASSILLELGEEDAATAVLSELVASNETDASAIARLEELYGKQGQHRNLVEILYKKADLDTDVLSQKETYYRIAEIWEHALGDDQMAIDTYRSVLDLDDEDLAAIEALERLYQQASMWENLVAVHQFKLDMVNAIALSLHPCHCPGMKRRIVVLKADRIKKRCTRWKQESSIALQD